MDSRYLLTIDLNTFLGETVGSDVINSAKHRNKFDTNAQFLFDWLFFYIIFLLFLLMRYNEVVKIEWNEQHQRAPRGLFESRMRAWRAEKYVN